MAGFSLHAAQSVAAHDREALERLCRYGLRAPFSQERLSRRLDGKVVYTLRRPWPHAGGATHLILEPLDFLRHLGLPTVAPALAAARAPQPERGFVLPEEDAGPADGSDVGNNGPGKPLTRPPP